MEYYSEALIQTSLALAKRNNEESRREWGDIITDYYEGDQLRYIPLNPAEDLIDFQDRKPFLSYTNVTKHVVDALSYTYSTPPVREIKSSSEIAATINEFINSEAYNNTLQYIDTLTRLLGVVHVRPIILDDNSIYLDVWLPQNVTVELGGIDPTKPSKLITDSYANDVGGRIVHSREAFTRDYIESLAKEKMGIFNRTPRVENPLQEIPFVRFANSYDKNTYWVDGIGRDLVNANRQINILLTDLNWLIKNQVHSQMVIIGPLDKGDIQFGPNRVINITSENGDAKFISPDAKITELVETIKMEVGIIYNTFGLEALNPLSVQSNQSGVAIVMSKASVREDRQKRAKLFTAYEKELIRLIAKSYRVYKQYTINEDELDTSIQFDRIQSIPSDVEKQYEQHQLQYGIISPVDVIMRLRGVDREEALRIYKENLDILKLKGE